MKIITTRLSPWSVVAATPLSWRLQSGVAPAGAGLPPQPKPRARRWWVVGILLAYAISGFFDRAIGQSNVVSHASDFTSVEYYPAPNQQQMKSRLSGAEAQPLPGGLLAIKGLKLEMFRPDGKPEITVKAPQCIYNQLDGTASSAGRLELQIGDDKIRTEGEGFLWRQNDSFLTISNRVRTVIKTGPEKNSKS